MDAIRRGYLVSLFPDITENQHLSHVTIRWVQDASSTLAATVLSSALNDRYPDPTLLRVVDMCSAPGGKTAQLCSAGYNVTAIEASRRRTDRLKENLDRLEFTDVCQVVVGEGQHWKPSTSIHGILLDVPCSATGTGGRRPDVLRRDSGRCAPLLSSVSTQSLTVGDMLHFQT